MAKIETRHTDRGQADVMRVLDGLSIALGAPAVYTFFVRPKGQA